MRLCDVTGDIVRVRLTDGSVLVTYRYDAWGNFTEAYSAGGSASIAVKNPFRYRGYYYDMDLGLYYNISRYYDSNTCRFISPDTNAIKNLVWTLSQDSYKHLPKALLGKTIPQFFNSIAAGASGYVIMGALYG